MRGVVGLHSAGYRLVIFVEMNADKDAISYSISERCAIRQGNIGVAQARH